MFTFGLAIFVGAFLLFQVQPVIARFILPWFGGSPAVWTTCMLFFQVVLLGGYAYAHLSTRTLAPRRQVLLHGALLVAALCLLPITPGDHWKPPDGTWPTARILGLLTVCLGLPYLVLSATGPLMQAWFNVARPGVSPYRLYALSNAGSLLALISYPILVEPVVSRHAQVGWWSAGLGVFALLAGWCGLTVWRGAGPPASHSFGKAEESAPAADNPWQADASPPPGEGGVEATSDTGPRHSPRWFWFALPACGSVLLLAVTNTICLDIAVIPFLWVLPLSLYLLSFIVSFDSPRWYRRGFWLTALALGLGAVLWVRLGESVTVPDQALLRPLKWLLTQADELSLFSQIGIYLGALFVSCMVCHGEVYRLRPAAAQLTGYYLWIAAGGAFGGLFAAVLAPRLFSDYFELHVGLLAVGMLGALAVFLEQREPRRRWWRAWAWGAVGLALFGLGAGLYQDMAVSGRGCMEVSRSFYGVLKVKEYGTDSPETHEVRLQHGTTTHGLQFMAPDQRRLPTSYYTRSSGVGRAMEHLPRQTQRRIGVVGLGVGTMAAWGKAGDYLRIYEINDAVERLARTRFSYLADSEAQIEIVPGDARLSMERERDQRFDLLVLDAFSSDAIPVHLLTREAFAIYQRHLAPEGVLAVHISNQYLELEPVVLHAATHLGWHTAILRDEDRDWYDEEEEDYSVEPPSYGSDWILLTRNEAFLEQPDIDPYASAPGEYSPKIRLWTDDESNLFRILMVDEQGWLGRLRGWLP